MNSVYEYSHFGGSEILSIRFPAIKTEIVEVIFDVKLPVGRQFHFSENTDDTPIAAGLLNDEFTTAFKKRGFQTLCETCSITVPASDVAIGSAQVEVSAWKERVLVDVQFGDYTAMFFSLAKFQMLCGEDRADVGVVVLPCQRLQQKLSGKSACGERLIYDIRRLKPHFPAVPVKVILVDVDE